MPAETEPQLPVENFLAEREEVLRTWSTGAEVDLEEGISYQLSIPSSRRFTRVLAEADREQRVLVQPRAGVALVDEHIALLRHLQGEADVLPTTIDAYTRQNQYAEAQKGIDRSLQAGRSVLNGACWRRSPWPRASPPSRGEASPTTSPTPRRSPWSGRFGTGSTSTAWSACTRSGGCGSTASPSVR